ncbi:hypothetical protein MMC29_000932 [Sticta canariensis]|nr:hypothetical protein [Sticta canariensis]
MQHSGEPATSQNPESPSEVAQQVYQFPSFPVMPRMPEAPKNPWVNVSELGPTHPPHQNERSGLPEHDRPVDPEGAIESSHVTLDPSQLPQSSGLHDPLLAGVPTQQQQQQPASLNGSSVSASDSRAPADSPYPRAATPSSNSVPASGAPTSTAGSARRQASPQAEAACAPAQPQANGVSPGSNSSSGALLAGGTAGAACTAALTSPHDATQQNGTGGVPGAPVGQDQRDTGHSGQPATGSGHAQPTVNPVSDTATEIAGGSAGDVSGAPRSDEVCASLSIRAPACLNVLGAAVQSK